MALHIIVLIRVDFSGLAFPHGWHKGRAGTPVFLDVIFTL